jgi:RNA polymerase sigma factor (sigma-70 family)
MTSDNDRQISEVVARERSRLRSFIRRRVANREDAEDILQDVFQRLVEANALLMPIEHVTGWLFRVARNRIIDVFRKKRPDEELGLEELLRSHDVGPDGAYDRSVLLDAIETALADLPEEQRRVFIAHEVEGRSFKEMAEESGISVNTLLSRKRYAVLRLRERLQNVYDDFTKTRTSL